MKNFQSKEIKQKKPIVLDLLEHISKNLYIPTLI
jgi:hypothetical protein